MRAHPSYFYGIPCYLGVLAITLAVLSVGVKAQPVGPAEPATMLPAFKVQEAAPWYYFNYAGVEALLLCDPKLAEAVTRRVGMLNKMLLTILPPRFVREAPETLIFVDKQFDQNQMLRMLPEAVIKRHENDLGSSPSLSLADTDMSATCFLVSASFTEEFHYTPKRIEAMLEARAPPLPDWFVEGYVGFYSRVDKIEEDRFHNHAMTWISEKVSAEMRAVPNLEGRQFSPLMPMGDFFSHRRNRSSLTSEGEAKWRSQAELFIRWALLQHQFTTRNKLGTFVDRLEREPLSEKLFQECFGYKYAEMRNELSDYLRLSVGAAGWVPGRADAPPNLPKDPTFRPATDLEVARLLGDWRRLTIGYIRQNSPALAEEYVAQARRTLDRAFKRGERDPGLLAVMGLTELEAGNPAGALPLLEEAAAGGVQRARVYFELARLRYAAIARANPPNAKLTAMQVAEVLGPLFDGQRQNPALLENYALFAEVLGRSSSVPTATELLALREGAMKFPRVSELVSQAIYLHLMCNQTGTAAELNELGLRFAESPATRAKFERAKAAFSASKSSNNE